MSGSKGKGKEQVVVVAGKSKMMGVVPYVFVLLVGLGVGWFFGYEHGLDQVIPVAVPMDGTEKPLVTTDSYGRALGHPHYGHGHP